MRQEAKGSSLSSRAGSSVPSVRVPSSTLKARWEESFPFPAFHLVQPPLASPIAPVTPSPSKLAELSAIDVDVVIAWADSPEVTRRYKETHGLHLPFATITEPVMRTLGLYVSEPKDYQAEQTHKFSEPGYFFLSADQTIQYLCYASHPMGGRVNVDSLLAGLAWIKSEGERNPAFKPFIFGNK